VLEILDHLARLGIPVPESLRDRLKHMLRGGNGEKRHEQDDRRD
jgi:phage-related holin